MTRELKPVGQNDCRDGRGEVVEIGPGGERATHPGEKHPPPAPPLRTRRRGRRARRRQLAAEAAVTGSS